MKPSEHHEGPKRRKAPGKPAFEELAPKTVARKAGGSNFRELRRRKGMTQAQLAAYCREHAGDIGRDHSYISRIEGGKATPTERELYFALRGLREPRDSKDASELAEAFFGTTRAGAVLRMWRHWDFGEAVYEVAKHVGQTRELCATFIETNPGTPEYHMMLEEIIAGVSPYREYRNWIARLYAEHFPTLLQGKPPLTPGSD